MAYNEKATPGLELPAKKERMNMISQAQTIILFIFVNDCG